MELEISLLVTSPVASVAVGVSALVAATRSSLILTLDTDVELVAIVDLLFAGVMDLIGARFAKHLITFVTPPRDNAITAIGAGVGKLDVRKRQLDSTTDLALALDEKKWLCPHRDVALRVVPVGTLRDWINVLDNDATVPERERKEERSVERNIRVRRKNKNIRNKTKQKNKHQTHLSIISRYAALFLQRH